MTKKIESLIEKCKSINPFEGRVLVHPDKLKTYKDIQIVNTDIEYETGDMPELYDDKGNVTEVKDPIMKTEEKEVIIKRRYQTATVLAIHESEDRFKIGDTIIYRVGTAFEFDLIKGVSILQKYGITASKVEVE